MSMRTFRWALVSGLVACGSGAVATAPDGDPDAARPPGAVPDGAAPANGVGDGGVDAADAADAAPRPIANGSSLSFDGVDDLLSLETVITTGKPENVTLTTPMTIEMWVKPDADASFPEVVFESSSAGVAVNLSVQLTPVVQCSTNGAHINIVAGTTNVADGQWHHIACTSDGKTARVYVDGVADGLPLGNLLAVPPSVAVLRVGRSVSFPTAKRFKGKLDELRIWSTPRTAQETSQSMRQVGARWLFAVT